MKCNCLCHSGAGVMHYEFIRTPNVSWQNTYSSSSASGKMLACPCDLNIKIQQLTKDYYQKKEKENV